MDRDQSQSYDPMKSFEPGSRAKIKEQALALKQSRFSSELERLRAVSKRTFSSDNRMAVQTLLGAIFKSGVSMASRRSPGGGAVSVA